MKNKEIRIKKPYENTTGITVGLIILLSIIIGVLSFKKQLFYLILFPGILAAVNLENISQPRGESFYLVWIMFGVAFLFWLVAPWILFLFTKLIRNKALKKIVLIIALAVASWSFAFLLPYSLVAIEFAFFPVLVIFSISLGALIVLIYRRIKMEK